MSQNTGYKAYANLEQYYLDNSVATGVTKTNSVIDPDYVAPIFDLVFCPFPSATPSNTPSISVTPSITPSVTPSISKTPSITPSISVSISVTATPSVTPSITPSISISATPSITPSKTPSVTPSPSVGKPDVTGFGASAEPCIGGSCDDYMGYSVYLNGNVAGDTNYALRISMYNQGGGGFAYYQTVYGTILTGNSYDSVNINPCLGGGVYIGCTVYPGEVCLESIDTTYVHNTYTC